MKNFLTILSLFFVSLTMFSQTCCTPEQACNLRSISVANGPATSLQLVHVGPTPFQPTAGQQTNWVLGTISNPNLTNVTTTATSGNFIFNLTALGITTSDIIAVNCIITNTNGAVCSILNETLEWTLVNAFTQTFLWRVTSPSSTGVFQAPLPVDWLSFDGKSIKGDSHLNWSTASEINNEGYSLQVSSDNNPWETIGFVNGKGNASSASDYNFVHHNAPKQRLYYKLIQVDYDGSTNESITISVDNSSEGQDIGTFEIYPNPSNGTSTIDLGLIPIGSFNVNIYNSIGQLIESNSHQDINKSTINLNLSERGLYFIQIYKDGKGQTKRLLVK